MESNKSDVLARYKISDLIRAYEPPYFRCIGRARWFTPLMHTWRMVKTLVFGGGKVYFRLWTRALASEARPKPIRINGQTSCQPKIPFRPMPRKMAARK